MRSAGKPKRSSRARQAPIALRDRLPAVAHPIRRRVLRVLHEAGEARSPNEISEVLDAALSSVAYHVRVLRECGMVALTDTRPRGGSTEHFYISTVANSKLIGAILEATRAEDEEAATR